VARALLQVMLWVGDRVYDGDRAILDGLDFLPNLTEADEPLRMFMEQVEQMPVASAHG
jgi:hypothetical protein